MKDTEVLTPPVSAEVPLVGTSRMERLVHPELLVSVKAEILAILIRERSSFAIVAYSVLGRIDNLHILRHLHSGIGPSVIWLEFSRMVVPEGACSEPHCILRQIDFHHPAAPGQEFAYADIAAYTAVLLDLRLPVNGVGTGRSVPYHAVVELDSAAGPRTPEGYLAELYHVIVIKEFLPAGLVIDGPYFSAYFREYFDPEPLVFKDDHLPSTRFSLERETVESRIGINPVCPGDWVRVRKAVSSDNGILDDNILGHQGKTASQQEQNQ